MSKEKRRIEGAIGDREWSLLTQLAGSAVQYAEQMGYAKKIRDTALAKKEFALAWLQDTLTNYGLKHVADNLDLIEGAIESSIRQGVHKRWEVAAISREDLTTIEIDDTQQLPSE